MLLFVGFFLFGAHLNFVVFFSVVALCCVLSVYLFFLYMFRLGWANENVYICFERKIVYRVDTTIINSDSWTSWLERGQHVSYASQWIWVLMECDPRHSGRKLRLGGGSALQCILPLSGIIHG